MDTSKTANELLVANKDLRQSLGDLADEAQILLCIIQDNTRDGVCVLRRDMTIGTQKAIRAARAKL